MNDREFIQQLKKFIDEHLEEEKTEIVEPIPIVVKSSEEVLFKLSELSKDLQEDYAKASPDMKKYLAEKWRLKVE